MVIEDFAPDDFINLYLVEGLAYQYWRATAMMRTLGKGWRLTITPDGDWTWSADEKFAALIRSIDERTDKSEFQSSFVGLWFDLPEITAEETKRELWQKSLLGPMYNVDRISINELLKSLRLKVFGDGVTNFIPAFLNIRRYLTAHSSLSEAMGERYQVGLEAFIGAWTGIQVQRYGRAGQGNRTWDDGPTLGCASNCRGMVLCYDELIQGLPG
jgi:hypothetical protein